jgi:hypothetical protein
MNDHEACSEFRRSLLRAAITEEDAPSEEARVPEAAPRRREPTAKDAGEYRINAKILRQAVAANPDAGPLTTWSPESVIVLDYLSRVTPRFSRSEYVREILEANLKLEYPALWTAACTELANQSHGPRQRRSRRL